MRAEDYLDNEWVTHLGIGEEPPEATIPKEDPLGNPMVAFRMGRKYQIRQGYFSGKTYVQEVEIKKRKKERRADVRAESAEAVRRAREEVLKEANELVLRHRKRSQP